MKAQKIEDLHFEWYLKILIAHAIFREFSNITQSVNLK